MKKFKPKKKMRILVLMHKDLIPPDDIDELDVDWPNVDWETEYDVCKALSKMGHEVFKLGVISDLKKIRDAIDEFKPHIVFNLLEEFDGEAIFDQNVVSYLELLHMPYTGSNPRGLILARDKALTKKILKYHRIKTPRFWVFPKNRPTKTTKNISYPVIVKCLNEEASLGITKASVVYSEEKLKERVDYINRTLGVDAIAEQFIEGREFYVGVFGNHRLTTLPVWELFFKNSETPEKEFYSSTAKFNDKYRVRKGIDTDKADIPKDLEEKIFKICKKAYRALDLNGYARMDLRMTNENEIYVLEANPNPNIAELDEFACSALHVKISYHELLNKIITLGLNWQTIR